MSKIPFILIPLLEYFIPVGLGLALALWRFKKKISKDLVVASGTPICLWMFCIFSSGGKSLSNYVVEPLILAGVILVLEMIRLTLDGHGSIKKKTLATLNIVAALLSTLCIAFLIPTLPE